MQQLWQCRIPDPLCGAEDRTRIQSLHPSTAETPQIPLCPRGNSWLSYLLRGGLTGLLNACFIDSSYTFSHTPVLASPMKTFSLSLAFIYRVYIYISKALSVLLNCGPQPILHSDQCCGSRSKMECFLCWKVLSVARPTLI